MPQDYKHFEVSQVGDITLLKLVDPKLFETMIVSELQDELVTFVETLRPKKVLVSFELVTHCSTAVINGLLRAKKRVLADKGCLKLCGMTDTIRDAYKMLNLDGTVFEIYDDSDGAVKSFVESTTEA